MKNLFLKVKINLKVTSILIGINIIMFGLSFLLSVLINSFQTSIYILGAEESTSILGGGEYFRMITSAFLHGGIIHIGFNMWVLYSIGNTVETFYGGKKLFTTYIITALTGSFVSIVYSFISFNTSGSMGMSVGASGAIFGLVGLILGNKYKKNTYSLSLDSYIDTQKLWMYVGYNVLIGFGFNLFGGVASINNWAHLGGLLGGLLLGLFLDPINTFYQSRGKKLAERVLFVLSVSLVVLSYIALIVNLFLK